MGKLSLYNLGEEIKALEKLVELDQGEITDEHEELEKECRDLVAKKTDSIIHFKNQIEDQIDLAKKHIEKLREYKRVHENKKARLEKIILDFFDMTGTKEVKGEMFTIKERKPAKDVEITDENKILPEFVEVEYVTKIKKAEIKKALKNGQDVGAAKLVDGKRSLTFK